MRQEMIFDPKISYQPSEYDPPKSITNRSIYWSHINRSYDFVKVSEPIALGTNMNLQTKYS